MAQMAVKVFGHRFRNPVIPAAGPNVGTGEQIARAARVAPGDCWQRPFPCARLRCRDRICIVTVPGRC